MQRIVVDPKDIWTPPIEIVNLDSYGNFGEVDPSSFDNIFIFKVFPYSCKVSYNGDVSMAIKVRASTGCSMDPSNYPFDVQECSIELSTPGLDTEFLKLKIKKWMLKNGLPREEIKNRMSMGYNETKIEVLQNTFFDDQEAWEFLGYKVEDEDVKGNDGKLYSRVKGTVIIFLILKGI